MSKPNPNDPHNKATDGRCGTCSGSGVVTEQKTDANGNTITVRTDCPSCGGNG